MRLLQLCEASYARSPKKWTRWSGLPISALHQARWQPDAMTLQPAFTVFVVGALHLVHLAHLAELRTNHPPTIIERERAVLKNLSLVYFQKTTASKDNQSKI